MPVRFVFGRSGTGKTWRCLDAVRRDLRADPLAGPELILLVPEQATLQIERALLADPATCGFARCEILSFRRLAYRLLNDFGGDDRTILSPLARQMVIQNLLITHGEDLRFFRTVRNRVGLTERLARTFTELLEQEIGPAELSQVSADPATDGQMAAKLADLATLFGLYEAYLATGYADPTEQLSIARRHVARCPWLAGARIWVDGFAGFTVQQRQLLIALAEVAERVEIALLMDPRAIPAGPVDLLSESLNLFARTERTYQHLRAALAEHAIDVEPHVLLAADPAPRFQREPALARLEHALASPTTQPTPASATPSIELIEAADRRTEVEAAIAHILHLTRRQDSPLRCRDIAIIVRDLEPYHDLIRAAMDAHNLACFIDRREPIAHHPLVQVTRAAVELLDDAMSPAAVGLMLKTGLTPLTDDQADALENYILGHGLEGIDAWTGPDWVYHHALNQDDVDALTEAQQQDLDAINAARRALLEPLGLWLAMASVEQPPTVRDWAQGLFELLERLDVPATLQQWFEQAHQAGRLDRAQQHQQVWQSLVGLLDDLVAALGGQPMAIDQFRQVIESGLASMTLALVPPRLDQVLVGSIERSRHPDIKVALLLGMSDRLFPNVASQDSVLDDAQRQALAKAGVEIGATSRQRLLDERMLAYIAMTRPEHSLWISWPIADEQGRPLPRSPFIDQLERILGTLPTRTVAAASAQPSLAAITRPMTLAGALAVVLRHARTGAMDDDGLQPWLALYAHARDHDAIHPAMRRVLGSLAYTVGARLDRQAVELLHNGRRLTTSVSQLEQYARCPFAHFAGYTLRLQERRQFKLEAVDLGRVYHGVLDRFARKLIRADVNLGTLDDQAIANAITTIAAETLDDLHDELMLADPAIRFRLDDAQRHLRRATRAHRFARRGSQFAPCGSEVLFDNRPNAQLPALTIRTAGGHVVTLRGRIDRVDVARLGDRLTAVVLDYKTTRSRTLNLAEVYHGLSLQLLSYLLVLAEHGHRWLDEPIDIVGAFYAPLLAGYTSVDDPDEDIDEAKQVKDFKFRGLFDFEYLADLDADMIDAASTWAGRVAAYVGKDGSAGNIDKSDFATTNQLRLILDHVRRKIGVLADAMLAGQIDIAPIRLNNTSPCTYCDYGCVCRFEPALSDYRSLNSMRRTAVFDALEQAHD